MCIFREYCKQNLEQFIYAARTLRTRPPQIVNLFLSSRGALRDLLGDLFTMHAPGNDVTRVELMCHETGATVVCFSPIGNT